MKTIIIFFMMCGVAFAAPKITYLNRYEIKHNGNYRAYFKVVDDGLEYTQDCQIENKGIITKVQQKECADKLEYIIAVRKQEDALKNSTSEKLKYIAEDLKIIKEKGGMTINMKSKVDGLLLEISK